MTQIKILTGSVRPGRFNVQPARWILEQARLREDIDVELLDLEVIDLPLLNEPIPPSQHQYSKEHTKKWSETIDEADGFIFVTPEYNHSYSPVLKNAIDYLYTEWNYKPVSFISYGSLAGGSRAIEHLRGVVAELKMYDLREEILLPNFYEDLNDDGEFDFNDSHGKEARALLDSLVFWSQKMREARIELRATNEQTK